MRFMDTVNQFVFKKNPILMFVITCFYFVLVLVTEVVSVPMKPDNNEFDSYEYENVYLHTDILKSTMEDLKTLHIREDDVFVVSFPKTGRNAHLSYFSRILFHMSRGKHTSYVIMRFHGERACRSRICLLA